ncbi:MAG: hypothetical protein AAFV80_10700, partial [Bacteroidota bacterium]
GWGIAFPFEVEPFFNGKWINKLSKGDVLKVPRARKVGSPVLQCWDYEFLKRLLRHRERTTPKGKATLERRAPR